jgi:hypothetical protein
MSNHDLRTHTHHQVALIHSKSTIESEYHRAAGTLLPPTNILPYPVYLHVTLTNDLCKVIQADFPNHPQQLHRSRGNVVQS